MTDTFGFSCDVLNDSQVMRLDAETFRVWVLLLALASKQRVRVLPEIDEIDFLLRINDAEKTAAFLRTLLDRSVLDEEDGKLQLAEDDVTWDVD